MAEKDSPDLGSEEALRRNRATSADKLALGVGAAAAILVATGIHMARKSGMAIRKYTIREEPLKEYWQFDYLRDSVQQTRYFHGTEAAVHRRIRHYQSEMKDLKKLSESEVEIIKTEPKAHMIEV